MFLVFSKNFTKQHLGDNHALLNLTTHPNDKETQIICIGYVIKMLGLPS